MIAAAHRCPEADPPGTARSISSSVLRSSIRSTAASDSTNRIRRRAPTNGTTCSPYATTQATATWLVVVPRRCEIRPSASTRLRFAARCSPLEPGLWARKSAPVS